MIIPKESHNSHAAEVITVQIPSSVPMALHQAALEIQSWLEHNRSEHYKQSDLVDVLRNWLELQIESLAEEAIYHCVSGSSTHAIGRRTFEQLLNKKPYGSSPEDIDLLYQATSPPVNSTTADPEAA